MSIRGAIPADAPDIARIHVAAWQAAYAGILADDYLQNLSVKQRQHQWQEILTSDDATTCVLEHDGQIVGWVCGGAYRGRSALNAGEIYALYVDPNYWRQGFGQQLLQYLADALTLLGYQCLHLWVLADNHNAQGFYHQAGFRADGEQERTAIGEKNVTEIRLSR
jgi:ribosomal protein S18 acetylase RimI-like enzyme